MLHLYRKNSGYYVGNLICKKCGKEWVGVWSGRTRIKNLECPNCGKVKIAEIKFPYKKEKVKK